MELPHSQFRAEQKFYIVDWARTHLRIGPKIGSLDRTFNCSRYAIHSALANGLNEPKSRGRHSAVSAESDANILAWITGKAERNAAVTRTDIKNYCREVCKIAVTRERVDSFISHHSAELIETKSSPQEAPPCKFSDCFLIKLYAACTKRDRIIQSTWCSISMKSGYPTGKTDKRRRWWFRDPPRSVRFIIDGLGA
jgi:hypothetical protein